MKNLFIIALLFPLFIPNSAYSNPKIQVIFGGSEYYPLQIFKDKRLGQGFGQQAVEMLLKDSNYEVRYIEMTNLRQKKELSKDQLFCRGNLGLYEFGPKQEKKKSQIEQYVEDDITKTAANAVSFKTMPFMANYTPGYITIRENKLKNYKAFFQSDFDGFPGIDAEKLINQRDFKTGWIPGGEMVPTMLVNAAIDKKVKRLETVMDYEYNFFRMVESSRIDFYYDSYGLFIPKRKNNTAAFLIKKYPELKNLISLRVVSFDYYSTMHVECTNKAKGMIEALNKKITEVYSSDQGYRDFVKKSYQKLPEIKNVDQLIIENYLPGYHFMKALEKGQEKEYIEQKKRELLKN